MYVNSVLTDGQMTSTISDSCPVDYPVRLSSGPCAGNKRELKQRRRWQRERPESNRFRLTKQQLLQVHHAFLHICLPSLLDYDVKLPNFAFYGGPKHKRTIFFFFCELRYSALEFNSWKIAKICQIKGVGIRAMKYETVQIHFLLTFSLPSPSSLL